MGKNSESQLDLLRNITAHKEASRDSASLKSNREAKSAINPAAGLRKHVLKQNAAVGEINVMYFLPCSCQFLLSSASFPWGS